MSKTDSPAPKRIAAFNTGVSAESSCADWLLAKGYRILARRFRSRAGEIDIIASDGRKIRFTEVKYRPQSRLGAGIAVIDEDKRRRVG